MSNGPVLPERMDTKEARGLGPAREHERGEVMRTGTGYRNCRDTTRVRATQLQPRPDSLMR